MMARFDEVYMAPRVRVALNNIFSAPYRRKFFQLVDKLRQGHFDLKGLNVEKLHTRKGKVYSARLNVELRVIFSMFAGSGKRSLVIWDANHHDDAYSRVSRASVPYFLQDAETELLPVSSWGADGQDKLSNLTREMDELDSEEMTDGLLLFALPHYVLTQPEKYASFEANIDRYLRLTPEQKDLIARSDKAYLVQGSAGTGKTTLALFHALNLYEQQPEDDVLFFTYQEELACVCRCYKVNLVGDQAAEEQSEKGGLRVFSYLEFCRHYLQKSLDLKPVNWKWIDKAQSLQMLQQIIDSKSRWQRSISAADAYNLIYSILKGRLVPGQNRFPKNNEDYHKIFKGYASAPKNLEEVLEIFELYESRLEKSACRDEADLIRYCYESMKDNAVLTDNQHSTWIVIDEIQDFTELEWKSILLFWENKCTAAGGKPSFPFLSGDRNQNISRSGFRWQEVDAYVEAVLKKMHRPNSSNKVNLHDNFRNSAEIFALGKAIRTLIGDGQAAATDIGLPPKFHSARPKLVVGSKLEFLEFLKQVSGFRPDNLPAPLVVLFEDDADLKSMKEQLPVDDGLFLMSLPKSKGLEFEDCIIYRLFSSLTASVEEADPEQLARLFDLWYMSVMRARNSLLIYLTPEDFELLKKAFAGRLDQLLQVVDFSLQQPLPLLNQFYESSEKYLPNYSVVFLERAKAQESWSDSQGEGNKLSAEQKDLLIRKALRLWKKCRDWKALGQALRSLQAYEQAITYLSRANLLDEVAFCYERLGQYEKAAPAYEECPQFVDAARCYALSGQHLQAAQLYESQQMWEPAAECFAQAGDNQKAAFCQEKAGNWLLAARLYSLKGQWLQAAEMFTRAESYLEAAQMYLKLKDKLDAARCYALAGEHLQAANLLESLNRWQEAAECYEKLEQFDKAAKLWGKTGRLKDVANCAEKAFDWGVAADAYERMKNWPAAARMYAALNNTNKAAECFENAQDWQQALPLLQQIGDKQRLARCLEQTGDKSQAIDCYLQLGALNEAAHCYEQLENWQQAADLYLQAKNYLAAANMLGRLGRKLDASRLFLLCGQFNAAMELARQVPAGDPSAEGKHGDLRLTLASWAENSKKFELAACVYEHLGQYMLAADRFQKALMAGRAAQCFEKDKKHLKAAELYVQDGQLQKAGECYAAAQQWSQAANCFEKAQLWQQALHMYEKCEDSEGIRRCRSSSRWL